MSLIWVTAVGALFVGWIIATVKKSTPLALGLGVVLMGLLLILVVIGYLVSCSNDMDLTSSCRIMVKLLENGQSEPLLKALKQCVPDANTPRNIDLSSLHNSLCQAVKTRD